MDINWKAIARTSNSLLSLHALTIYAMRLYAGKGRCMERRIAHPFPEGASQRLALRLFARSGVVPFLFCAIRSRVIPNLLALFVDERKQI
jgi:hypothetical protein